MTPSSPQAQTQLRVLLNSRANLLVSVRAFAARGVSIASNFLLTMVVARMLPTGSAGVFFLVMAWIAGAATIGRLGSDVMIVRWVAARRLPPGAEPRDLVLLTAAVSTGIAVPFALVANSILRAQLDGLDLAVASAAVAAAAVFAAIAVTAGAGLRAAGRIATGTIADLGSAQLVAVAGILGLQMRGGISLVEVVLAYAVGHLVTAAWATGSVWTLLPERSSSSPVRALRPYSWQLLSIMGSSLLSYLLVWAPVLVLGAMSSTEAVAHFNAAARMAAFVALVPAIQASYLMPRFARIFNDGDVEELNMVARVTTSRGAVAALCIALPLVLAPHRALLIFGGDYGSADTPLRVLTVAAVVVTAIGPVNVLMLTTGYERLSLVLSGALLGATTVAMVLVAPSAGAAGVAYVSAAGSIAFASAGAAVLRRRARVVAHASFPLLPGRRTTVGS